MAAPPGPSPSRVEPTSERPTAPLGVKLYCLLGAIGTLFALPLSVRLVAEGGLFTAPSLVVLGFAVGQAIVLYGLWTLQPWAWTWAMVFLGLNLLASIVTVQVIGAIVGLLLLWYIGSKRSLYRRGLGPA